MNGKRVRARLARVLVVVAVALGGLMAGLVVAHQLRPGEGEVFQAATGLVPPGAALVIVSENDGPSIMSGPYQVHVEFLDQAPDHVPVVAAVETNASERAWSLTGREEAGNATIRTYRLDDLAGRVSVRHDAGAVEGNIFVQRDGDVQRRRQVIWGGAGTIAGGALGLSAIRRQSQRDTGATP